MKKRQKVRDKSDSIIKSLKKLKASFSDENLNEAAHKLLDLQLRAFKESSRAPNKGIISFDSRFLPLPEGVRPAAVETARLKFQVDNKQLQVSLYPVSSERFAVIGQIIRFPAGKILEVQLKKGRAKTKTRTNEFQIFRFEKVQKASYELEIYDDKDCIAKIDLNI